MKLMDIYNRALGLLKRGLESVRKPSGNTSDRTPQIILNALILVLLNIAAVTLNWRCDLTSANTYSLSQKSKKVVSTLKENMKIKVLFSPDLPAQHMAVYRYLRDLWTSMTITATGISATRSWMKRTWSSRRPITAYSPCRARNSPMTR
jgi:hypothetical protein